MAEFHSGAVWDAIQRYGRVWNETDSAKRRQYAAEYDKFLETFEGDPAKNHIIVLKTICDELEREKERIREAHRRLVDRRATYLACIMCALCVLLALAINAIF